MTSDLRGMTRGSRWSQIWLAVAGVVCWLPAASAADIKLQQDDTQISVGSRIATGVYRVADANGDGAVQIVGDGVEVDFQGAELVGFTDQRSPDAYAGTGIVLRGRGITLKNAKVRGFKVGILATDCPGLVLEDCDISGNYQKRLLSTPVAEDAGDWIFGHANDQGEWLERYGAGLYVKRSDQVTIRRVRARRGQNGICLDRVNDSKIYDNDCSFLSGWGLAMWRSSRNVISRNAFDFCIRGYSHGVYNRGQDSAGILMFEQNCGNTLAENSATHCGDGFFGFAGLEALGDHKPASPTFDYQRCGNNDNLLINNDFSFAAAHGIEMTFSFGNRFIGNRLVGNAICGVWGGYSQDSLIAGNVIEQNGEMAYGLERGGINIEHSVRNVIRGNRFQNNRCGVRIWSNPNPDFQKKPWGKANPNDSRDNAILANTFRGDAVGIELRNSPGTKLLGNSLDQVAKEIDRDQVSQSQLVASEAAPAAAWSPPAYEVYGETRPVGARQDLDGRQNIVMTAWGPYDFVESIILPAQVSGGEKVSLQVLGPRGTFRVAHIAGDVRVEPLDGHLPARITVSSDRRGLLPFTLRIDANGKELSASGTLFPLEWDLKYFHWLPSQDPRNDQDAWSKLIAGTPVEQVRLPTLDFRWTTAAPSAKVKSNYFGTLATTSVTVPKGTYRLWTVSDDGIRVWVDDQRVIDDWTWHPPKENVAEVRLEAGEHRIRVEHFEIDGYAQLQVRLEPAQ